MRAGLTDAPTGALGERRGRIGLLRTMAMHPRMESQAREARYPTLAAPT
jgi:hypothetical protein